MNSNCESLQIKITLCGQKLRAKRQKKPSNIPKVTQELHGSGAQLLRLGCWAFKVPQLGVGKNK